MEKKRIVTALAVALGISTPVPALADGFGGGGGGGGHAALMITQQEAGLKEPLSLVSLEDSAL